MNEATLVSIASCTLLLTACGGPESELLVNTESETLEILENLVQAGFPENSLHVDEDGRVWVDQDAEATLEASREMIRPHHERFAEFESAENLEQYRTFNLVSRSLDTICINGSDFDSNSTLSTALNWSINNYNRLNLTFSMRRTSGSTSGCDAVITARRTGGSGGSAGFPSGGRPYNRINIGTGTAQYGTNVVEHVITHELGHTIGFRHSDYFNRSISCSSGGNEGSGGVGAVHIPGTPTGATPGGSIMNACFGPNEDGEFTSTDVTALNYLY